MTWPPGSPGWAELAAAVAAALAVLVLRPPGPTAVPRAASRPWLALVCVPLVLAPLRPGLLVPAVVIALAGLGLVRWWTLRRRASAVAGVAAAVLHACEGLSADISAGMEPGRALDRAAAQCGVLTPVAAAHRLGGSVSDALRAAAVLPGAADLRLLGAVWQVSRHHGPGLGSGLALISRGLRADRATARVVAAELASARATARLLAALPVGVLLLGSGAGRDPWGFLLLTPAGWFCLAAGLGLLVAGLVWLESLAAGVSR